jgi:7-cyano-7-deazaguanine reductase
MKTKFLGNNRASKNSPGSFKILDPIVRQNQSSTLFGVDYWNAYEFSFLDINRHPVLKVVEIVIPASSARTVESKSLKLYLNSFYKKKFENESDVLLKITKDLSKLTKSEVKAKFIKKFSIEPKSLNLNNTALKFTKPKLPICFSGFRSICPVTSQPDFANIYICTDQKIEVSWLKSYLISFKEKGEFHEQCIEDMLNALIEKYPNSSFEVCGRFMRRGGIDINPIRSNKKTLIFKNFRVFNQ